MAPEGLKLYLRLGIFISALSLLCVFAVPRGSAEFVVSVLALIVGLTLTGLVMLVSWWLGRS